MGEIDDDLGDVGIDRWKLLMVGLFGLVGGFQINNHDTFGENYEREGFGVAHDTACANRSDQAIEVCECECVL